MPQSLELLRDLGRELALDGVLDVPDHFHTALFYSRRLRDQAFSAFRTGIDWDGYREKIASNPPPGNTP